MKETARSTAGTLTQPAPTTSIGTEEVAHDSRGRDQTPLLAHLRAQARANRLANRRLHEAMQALSRDDLHAPRTSFFPSLVGTLNHILAVDVYYLDALHGVAAMAANYDAFVAADTLADLVPRQEASDVRLIAYCDALTPPRSTRRSRIDRSEPRRSRPAGARARASVHAPDAPPRPGARDARRHGGEAAAARRVLARQRRAAACRGTWQRWSGTRRCCSARLQPSAARLWPPTPLRERRSDGCPRWLNYTRSRPPNWSPAIARARCRRCRWCKRCSTASPVGSRTCTPLTRSTPTRR